MILFIVFFIFLSEEAKAQKIDTIYHTNGNILTGDIKKLNYGVGTWSMQWMETISLKTPEILFIFVYIESQVNTYL